MRESEGSPLDYYHDDKARVVESVVLLPGMAIGSISTGFGGCKTRFPNRGGVVRLINSIFVGSLEAACRRTR